MKDRRMPKLPPEMHYALRSIIENTMAFGEMHNDGWLYRRDAGLLGKWFAEVALHEVKANVLTLTMNDEVMSWYFTERSCHYRNAYTSPPEVAAVLIADQMFVAIRDQSLDSE
jgi:hypothetical protein